MFALGVLVSIIFAGVLFLIYCLWAFDRESRTRRHTPPSPTGKK